ncbi:hypothetical protein P7C70_g6054, partial [Phenoliferia sp. Uapishka_3]
MNQPNLPMVHDVCGWTHCRQHVAHGAPGGIHRHYVVKHASRYPPEKGYESEEEPLDADAELLNRVFWAAAEGRHEAEDNGVEVVDPEARAFKEERFPCAGWACDENGEFLDEQNPAPRQDQLVDPNAPFSPFDDERQYGWADRISKFRMSKAQVDSHMRRHGEQEPTPPAFSNFEQYRKRVDEIEYGLQSLSHFFVHVTYSGFWHGPSGPEWALWRQQNFKAEPTDLPADAYEFFPFLEDTQTFYYRDTNLVLKDLLRNPTFVGRQSYAPVRHTLPDGDFITEPHTAHQAWDVQEKLDLGATQARLVFASDATECSLASGNASLHPVYMSTSLNDASLIREDRGALVIVAFIPILKCHDTSSAGREMFARYARQVRHHCMSVLMEPLRQILETEQLRQTADDLSWGEEGTEEHRTALDEVTQSITLVVIIYCYASSLESTATDRVIQDRAIKLYMEASHRTSPSFHEREEKGFNWARLHSMFHYVEWTEENGTAPHSDTAPYETAHIKAVKLPYRASNRCNAIVQILRANTRRDCLASLRGRLELAGVIDVARPMRLPVYQEPLTTLPGRGDRNKRLLLSELAERRQLPALESATSAFLSTYFAIPDYVYPGKVEVHTIASASFPVYARPAYLSNDTCKLMTQRLYATPDYSYRGEVGSVRGPRHNTLLVRGPRWAEFGGQSFDAYEVVRARMFFSIGYRGRKIDLCLGEVYKKEPLHPARRAVLSPVVQPVDVAGEPSCRVFLVSDILRSVHLQPLWGKQGVPKELNFMETLDRWRGSYAVGVFTDQHIFRLLFRPDAASYMDAIPRH